MPRLRLFTGRDDPGGRDEQYERLYVILLDASSGHATFKAYLAGDASGPIPMERSIDELLELIAIRNPDFYEYRDGELASPGG